MLNRPQVLVAAADAGVCRLFQHDFAAAMYAVVTVQTGRAALDLMRSAPSDLAILSTDLGDIGGIELIRRVRELSSAPIIALRRPNGTLTAAEILDCGADDCVDQPAVLAELEARSRRLLRLANAPQLPGTMVTSLGLLEVDPLSHKMSMGRKSVALTPNEFNLLALLIGAKGGILTHEEIMRKVWGPGYSGDRRKLRQTISSLSNKIGDIVLRTIRF
jgi:two-component system KDP operon response regulator KdpE